MPLPIPALRRRPALLELALAVTSFAIVTAAPFSAWDTGIPGGNFNRNLAYPFVLMFLPLLAIRLLAGESIPWPATGYSRTILGTTSAYFVFLAVVSVGAGLWLGLQGFTADGQSALIRSIAKAQVPLAILVFVWTGWCCHVLLPLPWLRTAVRISAVFVIAYGFLQLVTVKFGLTGLHSMLASVVESGQVTWKGIYTTQYDRLNLTTSEPAEAGRMILLYLWPLLLMTDHPGDRLISFNRFLLALTLPLLLATKSATVVAGLAGLLGLALLRFGRGIRQRDAVRLAVIGGTGTILALFLFPYLESVVVEKVTGADPENRSSETRYAFAVASARIIGMNPLTGVGWANEIYWLESVLPRWGWNYEIKKGFAEGDALSAKSGFLRLATYGGLPAMLLWCAALFPFGRTSPGTWRGQPMLAAWPLLLILLNTLDGGILSSAYQWFFLGHYAAETGLRETRVRSLRRFRPSPVPNAPVAPVPAR